MDNGRAVRHTSYMTPPKRHYSVGPHGNACGRASALNTTNVYNVTCLLCQANDQFLAGKRIADDAKDEAFKAQAPRTYAEPWTKGNITCRECGSDQFRYQGRSCYGHYDDHVCANCGHTESRLTETGMCF